MPKPKFKSPPVEFQQHQLFPGNVFDLLPQDHDCFVYADLFEHLDTRALEATYHHLGQRAYHPRHIVSILIYAYSHGVFSSREIERRCHQDLAFMYIAQRHCPNFRVLADFRKDHGSFFRACFKESVQLALELKVVSQ
jgi:transposase